MVIISWTNWNGIEAYFLLLQYQGVWIILDMMFSWLMSKNNNFSLVMKIAWCLLCQLQTWNNLVRIPNASKFDMVWIIWILTVCGQVTDAAVKAGPRPFTSYLLPLCGNTKVFPGQPRKIICPTCPESVMWSPPFWPCLKQQLPRDPSRRHPR